MKDYENGECLLLFRGQYQEKALHMFDVDVFMFLDGVTASNPVQQ